MNLPILMYHSVSPEPAVSDLTVTVSALEAQVAYLRRKGFASVSLAQVAQASAGKFHLPRRPVVFTFDDAFVSVLEHARPVLARAGYAGTVFAVAQALGRHNFWDDGKGLPREACLTAAQLKALSAEGWEIGSHGLTHCSLAGLAPETLQREVAESRQALARAAGVPVSVFCYPFGAWDAAAREAVRAAGYAAACAISPGTASVTRDLWALRRVYVKPSDALGDFARKVSGWYLAFRAWRGR